MRSFENKELAVTLFKDVIFPQESCYKNKNDIIYINNNSDNKDEYRLLEHKTPNRLQKLGIPKSH